MVTSVRDPTSRRPLQLPYGNIIELFSCHSCGCLNIVLVALSELSDLFRSVSDGNASRLPFVMWGFAIKTGLVCMCECFWGVRVC